MPPLNCLLPGRGLHTVAQFDLDIDNMRRGAHTTDSKKELCQGTGKNKPDNNFIFAAIFSDDHLMAIVCECYGMFLFRLPIVIDGG